jgi:ABC-type multidrug transport system fused ATPase/permease subunit
MSLTRSIRVVAELTPEDEGQEDLQVPADWPRTGTVSVQNLAVRYDPDLPFVLNDVSFSLQVSVGRFESDH